MPRFVCALAIVLLAPHIRAQQREPGVPDIPAMQALWASVKSALTGPNGQKYFEENLKDFELPYLYGIVLSSTPKNEPSVLVIAMSDKSTPEVTLKVESGHLVEAIHDGAEIMFKGVPKAFSKQPFRLTIEARDTVRIHESKH